MGDKRGKKNNPKRKKGKTGPSFHNDQLGENVYAEFAEEKRPSK